MAQKQAALRGSYSEEMSLSPSILRLDLILEVALLFLQCAFSFKNNQQNEKGFGKFPKPFSVYQNSEIRI